jgi:hypothetical protein
MVAEVLMNPRGETNGRQSQIGAPETQAATGSFVLLSRFTPTRVPLFADLA